MKTERAYVGMLTIF